MAMMRRASWCTRAVTFLCGGREGTPPDEPRCRLAWTMPGTREKGKRERTLSERRRAWPLNARSKLSETRSPTTRPPSLHPPSVHTNHALTHCAQELAEVMAERTKAIEEAQVTARGSETAPPRFEQLVLGSMNADFCNQIHIFQHFSKSSFIYVIFALKNPVFFLPFVL